MKSILFTICCVLLVQFSVAPTPSVTGGLKAKDLPEPGACGSEVTQRIYGGNKTGVTEMPWIAMLEYQHADGRKEFYCGGVLINSNYVVTAGHCVNGLMKRLRWELVSVRLGEWDTSTEKDCDLDDVCATDPPVNVPVEEKFTHEEYLPDSLLQLHDIALVRLSRPVQFTDYIRPICLPLSDNLKNTVYNGMPLKVAGWGATENATKSDVKLKVEVDGVDLNTCNTAYQGWKIRLQEQQLCAGGQEGLDSCNGDSGGPLMYQNRDNPILPYYVLAGIVSFGPSQCGLPGWPGVYTRASKYNDWILSHMRP